MVVSINLEDHWWKLLCGEIVDVRSGRDLLSSPIPKAEPGLFPGREGALSESESEFCCWPDKSLFLGILRLVWLISLVRSLIEVCVGCWFRDAGLEVDLVLEAGLLDLGVSDAWIWAEVDLVLVLFSEFFLDLMAEGVVGLDVARVWVRWFISWLTSFSS